MSKVYKVIAPSGLLGCVSVMEQATGAAKGYAKSIGEAILVIEEDEGHAKFGIRCFPDGRIEKLDTSVMKAEKRMMAEFASEVEALGLKANMSTIGGIYKDDELFIELLTEPEPVEGNKAKIESLKATGYHVNVYSPYGWNGRRGFNIAVTRKVEITADDEKLWE